MNYFQIISISGISLILVAEVWTSLRAPVTKPFWLARCLLWLLAALAIAFPDMLTLIGRSIGIHRGADLLTYILALAFLAAVFLGYARYRRLQRELTDLARHVALREAVQITGGAAPRPGVDEPPLPAPDDAPPP